MIYYAYLRKPSLLSNSRDLFKNYSMFNFALENKYKYLKTIREISGDCSLISSNGNKEDILLSYGDKIYMEKIYFVDIKYKTAILFRYVLRTKNNIITDKIIIPSINKIYEILEIGVKVKSIHEHYLNLLNLSLVNNDTLKYFSNSYENEMTLSTLKGTYAALMPASDKIPLSNLYFDYMYSSHNSLNEIPNILDYLSSIPAHWDSHLNMDGNKLTKAFNTISENLEENITIDPEIESVLNSKYRTIDQILFELNKSVRYSNDFLIDNLNMKENDILLDYICKDTFNSIVCYLMNKGLSSSDTDFCFNYNFQDPVFIRSANRYSEVPLTDQEVTDLKFKYLNVNNIIPKLSKIRAAKNFKDIISFDVDVKCEPRLYKNINTVLDINNISLFSDGLVINGRD